MPSLIICSEISSLPISINELLNSATNTKANTLFFSS
ncbi:hypothetical protein BMETH_1014_0 [methanotrophic bacterial endosymbiont of Bathymodiolus sp.]|nr:hypothetical protein BMETH_1014_0 [methanotrophic bacterial endosymbiont of Bathymodiolus sp.]